METFSTPRNKHHYNDVNKPFTASENINNLDCVAVVLVFNLRVNVGSKFVLFWRRAHSFVYISNADYCPFNYCKD